MAIVPQQSHVSKSDEWLGAESHLPGLNAQLRRRARRNWSSALPLVAGAVFLIGAALGSAATLIFARSRRP